jgi:hypothetical protein
MTIDREGLVDGQSRPGPVLDELAPKAERAC